MLHIDAMVKAARALSGIRIENDTHEAALVAALTALEGICGPKGRGYRHLVGRRSLAVPGNPERLAGWTAGKKRGLLRLFGFRSAIHRRERYTLLR